MAFEAILHEVEQLHQVSTRLDGLAERYGVRVKESSVGSIGFVGGIRCPKAKSVDDDRPDSPKPSAD